MIYIFNIGSTGKRFIGAISLMALLAGLQVASAQQELSSASTSESPSAANSLDVSSSLSSNEFIDQPSIATPATQEKPESTTDNLSIPSNPATSVPHDVTESLPINISSPETIRYKGFFEDVEKWPDRPPEGFLDQIHSWLDKNQQWQVEKRELSLILNIVIFISIIVAPFIPMLILGHLAKSGTDVAYANGTELVTYFLATACLVSGLLIFNMAGAISIKTLAAIAVFFGLLLLLSLFGYQRQISKNLLSTFLLFLLKIAHVSLTLTFSFILGFMAIFLSKKTLDHAKNRKYAPAALSALGAAGTWRYSIAIISNMDKYINGMHVPNVASHFPDQGLLSLIKQGFEGYRNVYSYQKRWR